jgi:hypothetical protein
VYGLKAAVRPGLGGHCCDKTNGEMRTMNTANWKLIVIVSGACTTAAFAASVVSTIDGGGKRTTSANYTMDGSVGGIVGISSAASDTAKHGYIGQLTEVVSVSVTSTPASVSETATGQLSGVALYDDATVAMLNGSEVSWSIPVFPIFLISGSGVATTSVVYANTSGAFNGTYLGVLGSGALLVLDTNPDNYGSYAGDGLSDSWQVQYFGQPPNASAAPNADVDGTGQNNLFKYTAGLDPTNPASIFVLKIANVTGQPTQKNLIFNPLASGRTYTPEFRTNLVSGVYTNLTGFSGPTTNINQVTITDLSATQPGKFYRIHISLP